MSNVIQFSQARRSSSEEEDKRRLQEVEDAGSDAWARLLKARRLSIPDRIALATALYYEFEALREKDRSLRAGEFAVFADLSRDKTSRDLHKYMLPPPDESHSREKQKRDLRASAEGYRRFLKAIQRKTGGNRALLVERVTWATSFHPKQAKNIEESEKMLAWIQGAINRLDRAYPKVSGQADTLYEAFMRTASVKIAMRKSGSLLRWPYFDADIPFTDESPDSYPQYPNAIRLVDEIDTRYAYWNRDLVNYREVGRYDYPSWLSHYETITSLPRIYLGLIANWQDDFSIGNDVDAKNRERSRLRKHIGEIEEKRDGKTKLAKLVYRNPESCEFKDAIEPSIDDWCHAWLVIYPTPDNSSLAPVIYRPYAEGGVQLIYLNHRNFLKLKEFENIREDEPISAYDRIKELMGFTTGRFDIEEAWEATASDVLQNPVLRAHFDKGRRDEAFSRHLDNWWNTEKDRV